MRLHFPGYPGSSLLPPFPPPTFVLLLFVFIPLRRQRGRPRPYARPRAGTAGNQGGTGMQGAAVPRMRGMRRAGIRAPRTSLLSHVHLRPGAGGVPVPRLRRWGAERCPSGGVFWGREGSLWGGYSSRSCIPPLPAGWAPSHRSPQSACPRRGTGIPAGGPGSTGRCAAVWPPSALPQGHSRRAALLTRACVSPGAPHEEALCIP